MKSLALCAVLLGLLAGCQTDPATMNNHWRMETIPERLNYHFFTGYNSLEDGVPSEGWWDLRGLEGFARHEWAMAKDFGRTLSRHLLQYDPENPFEAPCPYLD